MNEVHLVVGCPVAHREWVLDRWFDHVEAACLEAGTTPYYVFVGDAGDDPTMKIVHKRTSGHGSVHINVPNRKGADFRDWHKQEAIEHMVELRNTLLASVRMVRPRYFLSLDSDMLLHPFALRNMLDDLQNDGWGAVGGKCYMTETGRKFPSWARFGRDGQIQRLDADGYFPVDVIMGIKLMTPDAYHVDYEFDLQGEDVGWSRACRRDGVKLAWDGRVASKHVLAPHLLHHLDPRVGY